MSVWEAQALLRAVPVAGDAQLGADFVTLIDPIRYPAGGLTDEQVAEIRRIKARVERERLPRGADPATHTKLGRGGLADVEWTVQLLQLRHAAEVPALRVAPTLDGARRARGRRPAGRRADRGAALGLGAGHPRPQRDLAGARAAERPAAAARPRAGRRRPGLRVRAGHRPGQFLDDYRRTTRRARSVVEQVFYGRPADG